MMAQTIPGFVYKAGMLIKDNHTGFLWRVPEDFGHSASYYQTIQANDAATGGILLSMLGGCVSVESPWVHDGPWVVQIYYKHRNVRMRGTSLGEACIAVAQEIGCWPNG